MISAVADHRAWSIRDRSSMALPLPELGRMKFNDGPKRQAAGNESRRCAQDALLHCKAELGNGRAKDVLEVAF
jgi:hypothetical protein